MVCVRGCSRNCGGGEGCRLEPGGGGGVAGACAAGEGRRVETTPVNNETKDVPLGSV